MFNILFLISTGWAQTETPEHYNQPISEVTRFESSERLDICEDNKGRQLFTRANIALGVGTGLVIAGTTLFWDGGILVGALATLAGTGGVIYAPIALPVGTHLLIKEIQQNDIDLFISDSSLYFVDILLISGVSSLTSDYPEASILIPAAYIFHEIQGIRMIKALNRAREMEC